MTNLNANAFPVSFKPYVGKTELLDEWGNKTGSFEAEYGDLQTTSLIVSANKGRLEYELFGSYEGYDRTMITFDRTCQIGEHSALWLDDADTSKPHNFVVVRVAPWKNGIAYAIRKVDLSDG